MRRRVPRRSSPASSCATNVSETRGYPLTTTTRSGDPAGAAAPLTGELGGGAATGLAPGPRASGRVGEAARPAGRSDPIGQVDGRPAVEPPARDRGVDVAQAVEQPGDPVAGRGRLGG